MRSLVPVVVWIPMRWADGERAAEKASGLLDGRAPAQFWDGSKLFGREVARSVGAADWTAWDIYLFYPPGAEWNEGGLPPPEAALAQVGGAVVGTKGTLPAAADQSHLPRRVSGLAEVVGDPSNLESLLSRVAEPFALRHASTGQRDR